MRKSGEFYVCNSVNYIEQARYWLLNHTKPARIFLAKFMLTIVFNWVQHCICHRNIAFMKILILQSINTSGNKKLHCANISSYIIFLLYKRHTFIFTIKNRKPILVRCKRDFHREGRVEDRPIYRKKIHGLKGF